MPPKTRKIYSKKTTKPGSSEETDTKVQILAPYCLPYSSDELVGFLRPEGRNQGHGPRPLRPGGGTRGVEGRRYPLANRSRVRCPALPIGGCPRGG